MSSNFFNTALSIGRPPNIQKLFPNSKALIISGKFINKTMIENHNSACIAVNGRNIFIIEGALKAANKANSPLIIEIAKSEGGINAYCSINYWNIARTVDFLCNKLNIKIPIVIHADHYTIKTPEDTATAMIEIPTLFEAGITSLAIDASYLSENQNLLTMIKLNKFVPKWSGLETEVGEIKGVHDLSTKEEALFMIQGLNAHNIFPDWIALNNGTVHGIETNNQGIQVELTAKIHKALSAYGVYGAQHGTSGNSTSKLRQIVSQTRTTKANIATALQMISWGIKVDENGNPEIDETGNYIKVKGQGMSHQIWSAMTKYAQIKRWSINDYKKLNLPFENRLAAQPQIIKDRMSENVETFVYNLLLNVFNTKDTAPHLIDSIVKSKSYFPINNSMKIENPNFWTPEKIKDRMSKINTIKKTHQDDFDD